MTQDEKRLAKYNEIIAFMAKNHRRQSKFIDEERGLRNWWKHRQKLMNARGAGTKEGGMFNELLAVIEEYKRKNLYQ